MKRIKIRKIRKNIRCFASLLFVLCVLCLADGCGQGEKGGILLSDASDGKPDRSLTEPSSEECEAESSGEGEGDSTTTPPSDSKPTEDSSQIYVQVSGAVANPGVYALPANARIFQAIDLAGGLTEEADTKSLNQAEPLADGQMVYVMSQEEAAAQAAELPAQDSQDEAVNDGRVNLNTATESDLMTLPGIGSAKAKSILNWREENGGFSQIEDLMKIQGIKEGVFSKIKDNIKVE